MLRRTLRLSTAAVVLFPLGSHGPSVLQRSSRLIGNRDARNAADAAEGFSGGRPNLHPHTLLTHTHLLGGSGITALCAFLLQLDRRTVSFDVQFVWIGEKSGVVACRFGIAATEGRTC